MQRLRAGYKLCIFSLMVIGYFVEAFWKILLGNNKYKTKENLIKTIQKYAMRTVKLLNLKIDFKGEKIQNADLKRTLVVSNHLSYLDILATAAYFPTCFVTSIEMKKTFFLGHLCEAGGCLYVERRNKNNIVNEIQDITNALEANLNVLIYPEATSTNGEEVKRFKRPLFKSAIDAGAKILPITLNYKHVGFESISRINRDIVCWYGDMTFFSHFWNVLKQESITLEINVGKSYEINDEDNAADLALMSHGVVNSYYRPIAIA